jgi:hypothetical protein
MILVRTNHPWLRVGRYFQGGAVHGTEKGAWVTLGERGPVALGPPEGIVFFLIYSKTFQTELNQFDPKMVFPYSKNSK